MLVQSLPMNLKSEKWLADVVKYTSATHGIYMIPKPMQDPCYNVSWCVFCFQTADAQSTRKHL